MPNNYISIWIAFQMERPLVLEILFLFFEFGFLLICAIKEFFIYKNKIV